VTPVKQRAQHLDRFVSSECRIARSCMDHPSIVSCDPDQVGVGDRIGEPIGWKSALCEAKRIAAPTQLKVELGDHEAVVGAAQNVEPFLCDFR